MATKAKEKSASKASSKTKSSNRSTTDTAAFDKWNDAVKDFNKAASAGFHDEVDGYNIGAFRTIREQLRALDNLLSNLEAREQEAENRQRDRRLLGIDD